MNNVIMLVPSYDGKIAQARIIKLGYRKMRTYSHRGNFHRMMFKPIVLLWGCEK